MLLIVTSIVLLSTAQALVPKPYNIVNDNMAVEIGPGLGIHHDYPECGLLNKAIKRFEHNLRTRAMPRKDAGPVEGVVSQLRIEIANGCDESHGLLWPSMEMKESYNLSVRPLEMNISADEIWGAIHGLETLTQLAYGHPAGKIVIQAVQVNDKPRFPHRGYLIDTSRHFLPVSYILRFIDAMSMVKMNVLHWHIVDDQSFPYVSLKFPGLSQNGSYNSKHYVYQPAEVQDILEYARLRGIRVMPEFDTPGHTQSWGRGQPGLLTECYKGEKPNEYYGPFNPARNSTYDFMWKLLHELADVFPDKYLHLGGDEVDFRCWSTNPEVLKFMNNMGMGRDFSALQSYYIKQVVDMTRKVTTKPGMVPVVWQEVFDHGYRTDNNTIIHTWMGGDWKGELRRITAAGFKALFSSCWYLNYIGYGTDWVGPYRCDPTDIGGTPEQVKLILGGEATMWAEFVDETNLISRSWPRGAAVAERLWSQPNLNAEEFKGRLNNLRCEMLRAGIPAEPVVGPGSCPPIVKEKKSLSGGLLSSTVKKIKDIK
ncbi:unnamed protein product [Echinostoma caproni]|uniref:Beta-hexosaminidase n=1 Tax=Echinostoma caproni TaxID=27848 RepID=A0A183AZR4_9TREM|nr:unnamed protein product [Echinostoma caproni]